MKKVLLISAFLLCTSISIFAQFSINADFRARSEYRDGSRRLLSDSLKPTFVSSQRTRLITDFKDDNFQIRVSFQNARIWGRDDERANVPNLNLSEGWFKYYITPEFSATVGRQHLEFDDGRIYGVRNWNDIAVSHDLAILEFKKSGWSAIVGGAYNNDGNYYIATDYNVNYYKYLAFLWVNKSFDNGMEMSILHSTDAHEDEVDFTRIYNRNTAGVYLKHEGNSKLGIEASAYYQYGDHSTGVDQSAYMYSIVPNYKINDVLSVNVGVNYFSGNNQLDTTSTVNRSFNKLFGDGHRYYGYLDYFLDIENNTKGTGMREMFASAFISFSKKSKLEVSYHHFATSGVLLDTRTPKFQAANAELGSEIDLQLNHKINSYFSAVLGYSTMFATSSMEILKGGDHTRYQQWVNLMLIAKPELFRSDKK